MSVNTAFAQPITRLRLHEEIVTIIQKQIMNGTIMPGAKLPPEREMAETFNVNRTTLREALHKLETLELLEIRHGDGIYAKNYLESGNLDLIKAAVSMDGNSETLFNVMEARLTIVPEIAALAAQRRTEAELAEIKRVIDREDMNIAEKDLGVHHLIVRATHNLVYTIMLNFFNQLHRDVGALYFNDKRNIERSGKFHREIYEAIKDRKPENARSIMQDVLQYADQAVKSHLRVKQ
jgi:GntR family transcriptional repressor for pyruvate dehydrogenase complex